MKKDNSANICDKFEEKRKKYREWLAKNPPIFDENTGQEMKECEGCYCQLFADEDWSFCDCCISCKDGGCETELCCLCYGKGKFAGKPKGKFKGKRKNLTPLQKRIFDLERLKMNIEDMLEEIRNFDGDPDDMRTAIDVENMERWREQRKKRDLESFSIEELQQEIERQKSLPPEKPKKSKLKKMICNICRKGFDPISEKDISDYCGEKAGKLYLACDKCQKKGFKSKNVKYE